MEITIVLLPLGGLAVGVIGTLMFGWKWKSRFRKMELDAVEVKGRLESLDSSSKDDGAKITIKNIENFTGSINLGDGRDATDNNDKMPHYLLNYPPNATLAFLHYLPGELVCGTKAGDLSIKIEEKTIPKLIGKTNEILAAMNAGEFLAPLKNKESRLLRLSGKPLLSVATSDKKKKA